MKKVNLIITFIVLVCFQTAFADNHFAVFMIVKGDEKVISKKGIAEVVKSGLLAYEADSGRF